MRKREADGTCVGRGKERLGAFSLSLGTRRETQKAGTTARLADKLQDIE